MSLPIADDEDDEIDIEEPERPVAIKSLPPKSKPMADKLHVVSEGEEECYWGCGVFEKSKMKRITMAGLPAYKCERC